MNRPKSNFIKGADPKTSLNIGNIRIVKEWMDHFGINFDERSVVPKKGETGQSIIEVNADTDVNATILQGNPDWKSGRTGSARIIFEFEE